MRVVFLGTPAAAVPSLEALVAHGHEVVLVVTRPDRRRGRGSDRSPSPVKVAAERLGLHVAYQVRDVVATDADIGVVVAYGAMIPADVLHKIPMLNVHFSLLPRWRGAAPVERAILAGDAETGVGIMTLEPTLDTGPLHAVERIAIGSQTASALTQTLAERGAALLQKVLNSPKLLANSTPQVGEPTYAEKLSKETFHLSPNDTVLTAIRIVQLEQAWCHIGERRIRIRSAHRGPAVAPAGALVRRGTEVGLACSDGVLWLDEVQPDGGRPMQASAWALGARFDDATRWS